MSDDFRGAGGQFKSCYWMSIFGVYLHLYLRNVFKFIVGGVICGTMLFATFLCVRFVKSTLKLKSNVRCGCSTRKRNKWLITIRQRHGHCQFCGIYALYGISDLESLRGHPRSLILTQIESAIHFLLVFNSNLSGILPHFRDIRAFARR